ncbi:MAG: helix-turn-helix domain-containing protein [Thaumarchaeota archaeon]|jgi:putative transcriptional regulator|nr:helix-turn-helix domain-containing protein [Nitrososphaerota archaeon]
MLETDEIYKLIGKIVLSENPGLLMKKIRENLEVKQKELAESIGVSPPVISDYEKGKRRKAGIRFIKKYVEGLIKLRGADSVILAMYQDKQGAMNNGIIDIKDYKKPIKIIDLIDAVQGKILTGDDMAEHYLFGHTVLDSIKAIIALKGEQFYRIFGKSSERALIFTKVGLGRSPMVAVRISPLKPRVVAIHGTQSVENLAIEMAKVENIVLALIPPIEISMLLNKINRLVEKND